MRLIAVAAINTFLPSRLESGLLRCVVGLVSPVAVRDRFPHRRQPDALTPRAPGPYQLSLGGGVGRVADDAGIATVTVTNLIVELFKVGSAYDLRKDSEAQATGGPKEGPVGWIAGRRVVP